MAPNLTGVLIKRENLDKRYTQRKDNVKRYREKTVLPSQGERPGTVLPHSPQKEPTC